MAAPTLVSAQVSAWLAVIAVTLGAAAADALEAALGAIASTATTSEHNPVAVKKTRDAGERPCMLIRVIEGIFFVFKLFQVDHSRDYRRGTELLTDPAA